MSRKSRLKVLHAMPETVYGVDAIAAAITAVEPVSSIIGFDFTLSDPLAGDDLALNYDDGQLGNKGTVLAGNHVQISFKVYATGAGTSATTVPAFDAILLSCLRKQTVDANVAYTLDQTSVASTTYYFWMDGVLHALTGARGSFKLKLSAKQLPYLEFTIMGLYTPPSLEAKLPVDDTGWLKPKPVGVEHTTCLFDAVALKLIDMEYDQGNKVEYTEYVGHQEIIISDCEPKAKLTFEAPTIGAFDPFAMALLEAEHSFSISHGASPQLFRWSSDRLQISRPKYGNQNGTLTYELDVMPLGESDALTTG